MERQSGFDDADLGHVDVFRTVGAWLRAELASDENRVDVPVLHLATYHAGSCRVGMECKVCGACWAFMHSDLAMKEEPGFRLAETLANSYRVLEKEFDAIEAAYVSYRQLVENPPINAASANDETILVGEAQRRPILLLREALLEQIRQAEEKLRGCCISTTLSYKPPRKRPAYLRTAIEGYLMGYGWSAREVFHLLAGRDPSPRDLQRVYDRRREHEQTELPPFLGPLGKYRKDSNGSKNREVR